MPKKQEQRVAGALGGRKTPASGALPSAKGDVVAGHTGEGWMVECKRTKNRSLSVKAEWLGKVSREALKVGKTPALAMEMDMTGEVATEKDWVAIPLSEFQRLTSEKEPDVPRRPSHITDDQWECSHEDKSWGGEACPGSTAGTEVWVCRACLRCDESVIHPRLHPVDDDHEELRKKATRKTFNWIGGKRTVPYIQLQAATPSFVYPEMDAEDERWLADIKKLTEGE